MKVLLVQLAFLGDVVLSTPLIPALKEIYSDSELWILTTPAAKELVENDPLVEGVIVFDKRNKHSGVGGLFRFAKELAGYEFDAAYSLHRSFRTSLLLMLAGIPRRVGFKEAVGSFLYTVRTSRKAYRHFHDTLRNLSLLSIHKPLPEFNSRLRIITKPAGQTSRVVQDYLKNHDSFIVVFPGSAWYTKQWHWRRYVDCIGQLCEKGFSVVLCGAQKDSTVCRKIFDALPNTKEVIDMSDKLSLEETLSLVSKARLVLSNDSMPVHMASALQIPNVAVFCATSPQFGFGPWKNRALVVEKEGLECKPCARHGSNACPIGTEECFRNLESRPVVDAVEALIA